MRGSNRIVWLASMGLAALAGGCQGSGGSAASAGGGPSPLFGQAYVPAQAEPPVEDAGTTRKAASRLAATDPADGLDGDSPPATAPRRSRWLPGNDKEPAPRKALPVSARTDSMADDDNPDH
ncbi:MAG: hypothetical protein ACM3U2_18140 [Deltaproteobacteria bacterium]